MKEPGRRKGWVTKIDKEKELARFKSIDKKVKESLLVSEESLSKMMKV